MCMSNTAPKSLTVVAGAINDSPTVTTGRAIFDNCCRDPISSTSVLPSFSFRKLLRIQVTHRDGIRDLIKQTSQCDGSATISVRLWLKEIGLAFDQVGQPNIIQVVTNTITGNLRFEVARFLSEYTAGNNATRDAVPWGLLREHLSTQFLNTDETQSLRDELDRINQSPYDSIPQISRKFRELADSAYPTRTRNNDQELTLVRAFARGLTSNVLARKLIENILPTVSLEAAIMLVARYNERHDAYDRLG